MIVHAFEENIFPFPKEKTSQYREWSEEEKGEEYILQIKCKVQVICIKIWMTQKTQRNKIQVDWIKSALTDLKDRINNMSGNETRSERPDEIVDTVEKILKFNDQNQEEQGQKNIDFRSNA